MVLTALAPTTPTASTLAVVESTLADHGLRLGRAWPRDPDHLLLEVFDGTRAIAGQWFSSVERAVSVGRRTRGAEQLGQIVLQPAGSDRRLTGLARLLRRPEAVLVAHRPERRAVVRLDHPAGVPGRAEAYVKVVRASALAAVTRTAALAAGLPLRTPDLLRVDTEHTAVVTAPLPGRTLHDLLATPAGEDACRQAGRALAAVHRAPVPPGLPHHDAEAERQVTVRWQRLATAHGLGPALVEPAPGMGDPREASAAEVTLIHRDFHDKQVVVDDDGQVGLLDFDLMAMGSPVLDLANLLVHLELRAHQGLVTDAAPLQEAVLDGYQPSDARLRGLAAQERATWARLAAVYAFRPAGSVS